MILAYLVFLFVVGITQSIGLILRTLMIKDNSVPYAQALNQHWFYYATFFIILSVMRMYDSQSDIFDLGPGLFIGIIGPLMALRYLYIVHYLPRKHEEYV